MKYVTFCRPGAAPEAGVLSWETIISLRGAGFPDVLAVIAGGDDAVARVREYVAHPPADAVFELDAVTLKAPIPRPPKIICVGLNWADHAKESNMQIPEVPTIFTKLPTSVIGPGERIVLPRSSTKPDYEAEFAFVIGKGGRYIPAFRWREHVFGYMCLNDVSARDYQLATSQWIMGKSFDTFCPMGPWLVSADEVPDPHDLDIRLTINGELFQESNTCHLIFRVPDLITYLSSVFTLEPGDVVSTGTPAGVGFARTPPRFLQPGDEVAVAVKHLGELRNPVVAEIGD
jgi:2-keto-4-pentenoate hydratase/2-oxohepta-3-ene-1,7-dioic acid hydratase in catechol pathway